jgi:formylglycine-generating enzyme required for sulfatase activity
MTVTKTTITAIAVVALAAQQADAAGAAKDTTLYMGTTETGWNVPLEMVFVPGGTFTMGCTPEQGNDCKDDEKPAHSVAVSSFYIGKYEVMQDQWMLLMGKDPSFHYYKNPHWPVENVSWDDAQEFIKRLNIMTGKKYRLPTEAEWEYAARGGSASKGFKYSGGNRISDVQKKRPTKKGEEKLGHPSGNYVPNELGIYHMSGSVWEWVNDWYGGYGGEPQTDPAGQPSGKRRVVRGGSWYSGPKDDRVSSRSAAAPGSRDSDRGFRLVLSVKDMTMTFESGKIRAATETGADSADYIYEDGVTFSEDKSILIRYPEDKQGAYVIPNSVKIIGYRAFYNCRGLTSLTLQYGDIIIGDDAFLNSGLKSILLKRPNQFLLIRVSPPSFSGIDTNRVCIYVPEGSADAYRNYRAAQREKWSFKCVKDIASAPVTDEKDTNTDRR